MTRAHFYAIAQDPAGNAIENAVIRVLQPGTTSVIAAPLYDSDTSITSISNPFTTATGAISFYVDVPQRVKIGITPPNAAERYTDNLDVGSTGGGGGDSTHVGTGTASTTVGLDATSTGNNSVSLGQLADADGSYSLAVGYGAVASALDATSLGGQALATGSRAVALGRISSASGPNSIALGGGASTSSTSATAVGDSAIANSTSATALGRSATGGHDHSSAIGADSATTEPGQIRLGTVTDVADAPGGYVLTAANGPRGVLRMLPDGALTTTWHVPSGSPNLMATDEQSFEAGIGGWVSVSGLTSTAQSADFAVSGTKSLKMVLSGAGAASARSSFIAATVGTVYVGFVRMFYTAGAMTAGLNGTCWLDFYTAGDVLIGSAVAGRSRMFYPDAWIRFDVRGVAPATTAKVVLRVGLPTGGGAATNAFYADLAGVSSVVGTV